MQEGVIQSALCVICNVLCYVFKTLDKKGSVTMNNRMMISAIDPKFVPFILRSNSKISVIN